MNKYLVGAAVIALTFCLSAGAEDGLRLLFLTKSAGFEHGVIKRDGENLGHAEKIMMELAKEMGATIEVTKDAGLINAENLKNFDVVLFYTTGVLTEAGTDGQPPMGENGCQELLDWITAGGGFVGYHSANDTFHSKKDAVSPFVEMIGGEFFTHGAQFKGTLRVVSPGHPAIAGLPDGFRLMDEWYISRNLNEEDMHVLALLDPGIERKRQDKYNIPSYPIIWCRAYGGGRVLYNALGHREDVWTNEIFRQNVIENIQWAAGKGALDAAPNYGATVPTTIPGSSAEAKESEGSGKKKRERKRRSGSGSK